MDTTFPQEIVVPYGDDGIDLPYAIDLSRALDVPLLIEVVARVVDIEELALELGATAKDVFRVMSSRARRHAERLGAEMSRVHILPREHASRISSPHAIRVECTTHGGPAVLSPAGEKVVFRDGKTSILIPFGNGPSGLSAAKHGVEIAKRLGVGVVFYHTTWPKSNCNDSDPKKHMCPAATAVQDGVLAFARENGVDGATDIRLDSEVVRGVVAAALRHRAPLIVTAQGGNTVLNGYPSLLSAGNCPVPLLVLGGSV